MTILNREQIDACYPGPLVDTAYAYHDLVRDLNDELDRLNNRYQDDRVQVHQFISAIRRVIDREESA